MESMDRRNHFKKRNACSEQVGPLQSTRSNSEPSTSQSTITLTTAITTTTMARTPSKRQPWNLRSSSVGVSSKICSLEVESAVLCHSRDRSSTLKRYGDGLDIGAPGWIRTSNPQLRRLVPYPIWPRVLHKRAAIMVRCPRQVNAKGHAKGYLPNNLLFLSSIAP